MTISTNYSTPVMVNGFCCRNCTDVDTAKRNIDPAKPADGPFGMNAANGSAAAKARKSQPIDPVALAQAHKLAVAQNGSAVLGPMAESRLRADFCR